MGDKTCYTTVLKSGQEGTREKVTQGAKASVQIEYWEGQGRAWKWNTVPKTIWHTELNMFMRKIV